MKLYSYVVTIDHGLAPNPFWGYCTLAVCTPNHMGIKAQKDDWIIGTSPNSQGNKLVYAMKISETLSFESYYADARFEKKKPVINGSWRERVGDNMYYKDQQGKWIQHPTIQHQSPDLIRKDLKHHVVFVAEHFYYFGDKEIPIPSEFQELIWKRQGCKYEHNPEIVERFLTWLEENFDSGVLGNPKDNKDCKKSKLPLGQQIGKQRVPDCGDPPR
jgi:hypothetical protein